MSPSSKSDLASVPVAVAPRMGLAAVRRSKSNAPDRILVIGTEGVGKSTFAADAPNPIFIGAEDGLRHLDVAEFPQPKKFGDVLAAIETLLNEEHDYRTCVIDTIDWVALLIADDVRDRNRWTQEKFDAYGAGFRAWMLEWRKLLALLDRLRNEKDMEIILLAHTATKNFKNPVGDDYLRYQPKIGGDDAPALIKEWADIILFAAHEDFTTDKSEGRVRGVSSGKRVIHTERTAAWDAKNRHNLPPVLPLDYAEFDAARKAGSGPTAAELRAACDDLVAKLALPPESPMFAYLAKNAENTTNLAKALNTLRAKAAENEAK